MGTLTAGLLWGTWGCQAAPAGACRDASEFASAVGVAPSFPDAGQPPTAVSGGVEPKGDYTTRVVDGGPGPLVLTGDRALRGRLATFCACRGQSSRKTAERIGFESDIIAIVAIIAALLGGALASMAAWLDDSLRRSTSIAGSLALALAAALFGVLGGLGLPKRAAELDSAAEDQEYAAVVLLSTEAGGEAWSRALAACVHADSLASSARPLDPGTAYRAFAAPSGSASAPVPTAPTLRPSTTVIGGDE